MSTHATFLEHKYIDDFKPRSKVLLEDVLEKKPQNDTTRVIENHTDSISTRVVEIDNETENITDLLNRKAIMPKRSGRVSRPPDRNEANVVVPDTNDEDPSSYEEVVMDFNKEK